MKGHKTRYHSYDAHVSCSCGWTEQANDRADGETAIALHLLKWGAGLTTKDITHQGDR